MSELLSRLHFLVRQTLLRHKRQSELDEELQFHVEQSTEANIAAGMTAEEARRQALIEFGGVERTREQCHVQRPGWWMGTVMQDVRYALRGFRRNPVFTVTVIATLALGIGATTAVFSVVDRILFRSLPYAHDDRLVSVGLVDPVIPQEFMLGGSYYEWRDNQKPFEAFSSQGAIPHACDLVERNPALLSCASVEQNFLPMLGIAPLLGRNFLPEEDRPNGPKVAFISYGLWLTHYGLDPRIVNRLIDIDGNQIRVVGVLPKDFELPTLQAADVIVPQALDEMAQRGAAPAGSPMYAFARLKPGVSIEQAKVALQPEFNRTLSLAPPAFRKELYLRVRSIRDRQVHDVRLLSWILFGSVLSVLLIACANVVSLMMARGEARERELAMRSALGASRGRLIRQTFTEAALLSLAGTASGMALAEGLLRVFLAIAPTGIPFLARAVLDFRIALFTVLLSLICGATFGTLPALKKPRAIALAARATHFRKRTVLRRSLVVAQIAISIVLLSGASLLLKSFQNIEQQRLGMQTQGVLTARIALPGFRYDTGQKKMTFYLQAEAALKRLPGVRAVGVSDSMPPGDVHGNQIYSIIGIADKPRMTGGTGGMVAWRRVTPDYFSSLDIPILRGQAFTEEERTANEHYMILSSQLASRLFGNEDPIGKRIQPVPDGPWYIVSGIAANVKNAGLTAEDVPEYYRLRRNLADDWDADSVMVLKTSLSPKAVAPWVRSQIAGIDPTVPVEIETLSEQVSKLADRPRFETALLGFFAFCGLLMAVIGLYGVIAFVAAQRTQEIGVRMALGATRLDILRLIAGEGARLIMLGGVLGLCMALAVAHLLKSLLFQVGPHDPALFAVASLLLFVVAIAATLIPARKAMRVEPVAALRYE